MLLSLYLFNSYGQKNGNKTILKANDTNVSQDNKKLTESQIIFLLGIFILELVCCIISIILAIKCGKNKNQLILNLFVAIFFPFIYIFYAIFSGCYRKKK